MNERDVKAVKEMTERLYAEGWTPMEVHSFVRNMEEVSPDLDEDIACRNMARIRRAAEARIKGVLV